MVKLKRSGGVKDRKEGACVEGLNVRGGGRITVVD